MQPHVEADRALRLRACSLCRLLPLHNRLLNCSEKAKSSSEDRVLARLLIIVFADTKKHNSRLAINKNRSIRVTEDRKRATIMHINIVLKPCQICGKITLGNILLSNGEANK